MNRKSRPPKKDERPKAYKIATMRFGICDVCRKEGRVWQYYITSSNVPRDDPGDSGLHFCSIPCAENYHQMSLEEMPVEKSRTVVSNDQLWRAVEQIINEGSGRDARVIVNILVAEEQSQQETT